MNVRLYTACIFWISLCLNGFGQSNPSGTDRSYSDYLENCTLLIDHSFAGEHTSGDGYYITVHLLNGGTLDYNSRMENPIAVPGMELKLIEAITIEDMATGTISTVDEVLDHVRLNCAEKRMVNPPNARADCGTGFITNYLNCDGEYHDIDRSYLETDMFVHVDDDYITCIAHVDENCDLGESFRTFCTYYPGESAGDYPLGFIHYEKVIGIDDFNDATGFGVTDRQGEEINWVLCNARDLNYSYSQMNSAIWGILNQITCNGLCWMARDAITTPTGEISPYLEFYVPLTGNNVQPQVRNKCVQISDPPLTYICGEDKKIDTYVRGLLDQPSGARYIDIPDPATVERVIAEVWIEPTECPGPIATTLGLRADNGSAAPEEVNAPGLEIVQTSSSTTIEHVYRYTFEGSHGRISILDSEDDGCDASSIAVYVVRPENEGAATLYTSINREFHRSSYEFTMDAGTTPSPRDLTLRVPIHEKGDNNRVARVEAWYNGSPVYSDEIDGPTHGLEASMCEVLIPGVPGNVSAINVRIISPDDATGESFGVGSASITSDLACCPTVTATATGGLSCAPVACGPCDGKSTMFVMQYTGSQTDAEVLIVQQDGGVIAFDETLQPGEYFTFYGQAAQQTFGSWVDIWVNSVQVGQVQTSCSAPEPLVGQVYGDFEIVYAESLNGGAACTEDGSPIFVTTVQIETETEFADPVYLWTGPNGYTSTQSNPTVDEEGIYTVEITDLATGCVSSDTAEVAGGLGTANCSVSNTGPITCTNPSVFLDGESTTQGAVYQWTGPNGFSVNTENAVVTVPGTYTLTVTSPDGCPSQCQTVVAIDTLSYSQLITATICTGDSYTLVDGTVVTSAGTYVANYTASNGCDSTITTEITVLPPASHTQNAAICEGETITLPDGTVTGTAGTYTTTFTAWNGCDSIVTTVLTVWPAHDIQVDADICDGESYTLPNGTVVTLPGTYTNSYTTVHGCDSVITTILEVFPESSVTIDAGICDGEGYTLPDGSVVYSGGSFTFDFVSSVGCDSTVTINLTVANSYYAEDTATICEGENYTLPGGTVVTAAGTYTDSLTTFAGCDSVLVTTLFTVPDYTENTGATICTGASYTLPDGTVVTAPGTYVTNLISAGGCDSTITTDIATVTAFDETDSVLLCQGNSYVLPSGVQTYAAGTYIDTLSASGGCDSVITTIIELAPQYNFEQWDTICDGDSYLLPSGVYVEDPGVYINFFPTWQGCDSVITTYLTVLPTYLSITPVTICSGETYTFPDGTTINDQGIFGDTLVTIMGCDSMLLTQVTILPVYDLVENVEICIGSSYTLPGGTVVSSAGTYIDSLTSSDGCDSVITTILDLVPDFTETFDEIICDGDSYIMPDGSVVTAPGTFNFNLTAAGGCDSTVTINLDVVPNFDIAIDAVICQGESYTLPDSSIVSAAGIYIDSLVTANGCDSVITTNLSIEAPFSSTVQAALCSGEGYELPGGTITSTPGTYVDSLFSENGCDSVITTIVLTSEHTAETVTATICTGSSYTLPGGTTVTTAGTYVDSLTTWVGCDSVITTILDVVDGYDISIYGAICAGDVFVLPDSSQTGIPGTWTDTLVSSIGCDSIVTATVDVFLPTDETVSVGICSDEIYILPNGDTAATSGTYVDSLLNAGGCDSVITTELTINESHIITADVLLCDGESYALPGGVTVNTAGTYTDSLTTAAGCDSIITTVIELAPNYDEVRDVEICEDAYYVLPDGNVTITPGTYIFDLETIHGCDSVITVNLSMVPEFRVWDDLAICDGETVTLATGTVVNAAGTYIDSLVSQGGCDSIITTEVTLHPNYAYDIVAGICDGNAYTLPDGSVVTAPGTYTTSLTTEFGCDSIITTVLTVSSTSSTEVDITMCDGDQYTLPGGDIVTGEGSYVDTLSTWLGCDSIITTNISLLPHSYGEADLFACDADFLIFESGDTVWTDGEYLFVIENHLGCDSSVVAAVTFAYSYADTADAVICDGEPYVLNNGDTVYSAGTYIDSLQTVAGCDSIITLNLSVLPSYDLSRADTICEGEEYILPDGSVVTTGGQYVSQLATTAGCDSLVTVDLTALPAYDLSYSYTICEGDSVTLPTGFTASSDTVITLNLTTAMGCDSTVTHTVRANPPSSYEYDYSVCGRESVTIGDFTYTESGTYTIHTTNHFGCDSTIIMNLELNVPFEEEIDTALCPGNFVNIAGQTFTAAGEYVVLYTNAYGCDSTYFVNIEYTDAPEVRAREDTTIIAGAEVEAYMLYRSPRPLEYTWYVNDSFAHENVKRFSANYMRESIVRIEVRDSNNCQAQDEFRIFVEDACPDDLIFVPNIISPNYDNANDYFDILNPHDVIISEVTIFNRWGEIVYTAPDFTDPWDGTFRGQHCNPDVYTYFIQGTCASGNTLLKKGNITLLR